MADHIRIKKADSLWVVRAGGAVIGESQNALELTEGGSPTVVYFPREDVAMAFLEPSDHRTHCPHKGDARYFSIQTKSVLLENAVWSYEVPQDTVAQISGHLAFHVSDLVTVEQL